ncbi:ssk1 response regulator receiver [Geranomyces variabilis]|uniref:Ssk1 response regulator receiver n=1 Tax=Geranomyces variabilis TaxID=109894 RepID=A0AAD5TK72_9FUNG|nr:ssk1 response regulator receiver [Geranomyces variabilis]
MPAQRQPPHPYPPAATFTIFRRCLLFLIASALTIFVLRLANYLETLVHALNNDNNYFLDNHPYTACTAFAYKAGTVLALLAALAAVLGHRRLAAGLIVLTVLREPLVDEAHFSHAQASAQDPLRFVGPVAPASSLDLLSACATSTWAAAGARAASHQWPDDFLQFLRELGPPTSSLALFVLYYVFCRNAGNIRDRHIALPEHHEEPRAAPVETITRSADGDNTTTSAAAAASPLQHDGHPVARPSTPSSPAVSPPQPQPQPFASVPAASCPTTPTQQQSNHSPSAGPSAPSSDTRPSLPASKLPLPGPVFDSPRASRTSLWAAVATSQETNAWRDGTAYFGRELMNSVHAAKQAIDHAHVYPVMYEHYMHFVIFISALDTAVDNIEHIAWQLEHFDSFDNLPRADAPTTRRLLSRVLFDPVDVNERVGDAIANLADDKGLELIVHSSVQRGKTPEIFLVVGDEDYVRQLLLQLLYPIVASAPEYTRVEINLDLPPPWAAKEDPAHAAGAGAERRFHMDVTWQIVYQQDAAKPIPFYINDYMSKILKELGGELRGPKPYGPQLGASGGGLGSGSGATYTCAAELAFSMESMKFTPDMTLEPGLRLGKPVTYRQTDELYRFVETLRDVRVTILAPSRSTFTANIAQYAENWGMDLTYVATEDMDVIPGILTQLDEQTVGYQPHGRLQVLRNVIIINDDFGMLDVVINHRIENLIVGTLVIYFTSPQNHARMNEYAETTAEGHGELMPEVFVVTKPAGPRRLLQVLRWIMADRPEEPQIDDVAAEGAPKRKRRVGEMVVEGARSAAPSREGRMERRPDRNSMAPAAARPIQPAGGDGGGDGGGKSGDGRGDGRQDAPPQRIARNATTSSVSGRGSGRYRENHYMASTTSQSARSTTSSSNDSSAHSGDPVPQLEASSSAGASAAAAALGAGTAANKVQMAAGGAAKSNAVVPNGVSGGSSSTRSMTATQKAAAQPTKPAPVPHANTNGMPPPPPASSTPASISALLFSRIKVLIAEDNPINQTILSTFLRKRGISAAVAANGQEAVLKFQQNVFHIILMDIIMPVMDGIQATRQIRGIERERGEVDRDGKLASPDVVIVALTASSLPADRDAALAAGCNDYLIKPASLVWLERKILEWGAMQALIDYDTLLSYAPTMPSPLPSQGGAFTSKGARNKESTAGGKKSRSGGAEAAAPASTTTTGGAADGGGPAKSSSIATTTSTSTATSNSANSGKRANSSESPTPDSSLSSNTTTSSSTTTSSDAPTPAALSLGLLPPPRDPSQLTVESLDLPRLDHLSGSSGIRPRSVASAPGMLELGGAGGATAGSNGVHRVDGDAVPPGGEVAHMENPTLTRILGGKAVESPDVLTK